MLAGLFRLKHLGITRFTLPASISTALAQLPDERIAAASHIARELQITPWNLSSSFVTCATQVNITYIGNFKSSELLSICCNPNPLKA